MANQYAVNARAVSATRSTLNVVVIFVALLLNWLLLLSGPTRAVGLYGVVGFLIILYGIDLVLEHLVRSGVGCLTTGVRLEPESHLHQSPLNNPIAVYVGIWLMWWLAAHLFFEAGLVFQHDWWRALLLIASLASSLGTPANDYAIRWDDGPSLAKIASLAFSIGPDVFCLLFLVALALPTTTWLPQTTSVVVSVVRVCAYFVALQVADFFLPTSFLSEAQARRDDEAVRAISQLPDDQRPLLMPSTFCAIVLEYDRVRSANRRRTRRVIASAAWILVVAPATIVVFSIVLIVAQAISLAMRSSSTTDDSKARHRKLDVEAPPPREPEPEPEPLPQPVATPAPVSLIPARVQETRPPPVQAPLTPQPPAVVPMLPPRPDQLPAGFSRVRLGPATR